MAYTIKNADGTVLLNLVDGTVDKTTTSLTLIGRNTDAYGTALNTNLVNILQNFASISQPRSPLTGQLWYDVSAGRLKVFNLDGVFGEISASILSDIKPTILKQGDLWIDTVNDQLYFTVDGVNTTLAGPIYSSQDGKSGWVTEEVLDTGNRTRKVTSLYANDQMLGVLSTSSFELKESFRGTGFQYITAGLTLNPSIPGIRFAGTSTNADAILGINAQDYLLKQNNGDDQQIQGAGGLILLSDAGLTVGLYSDLEIFAGGAIGSRSTAIRNTIVDGSTKFITVKSNPPGANAEVTPLTLKRDRVGVNTLNPITNFHVEGSAFFNGNVEVYSNLYVYGTYTSISSTLIEIADKNIELAVMPQGTSASDTFADGGGLTLHGSTDKTLTYINSYTAWSSNIDFNIATGRSYKAGGVTVLTTSTLGPTVVNSNIRTLGVLTQLTVTNVLIKGSGISSLDSSYVIASASSTGTNIGSVITINLGATVPILSSGTTVTVLGIADLGYNGTYDIKSIVSTGTSFTVIAANTLSSVTAIMGANPVAEFKDLMLTTQSSPINAGIDATARRIKNVQYSNVPTDAATVQFAIDAGSVQSLKGFIVTLDVSKMINQNAEIITILNALAPPLNTAPNDGLYQNDYQYDLPIGYRARVLCQSNSISVPPQPVNVAAATSSVMAYPDGTELLAITNVAVSTVGVITTATVSYSIKEFRVIDGPPRWAWYRNIP
jgi:hypothetical protein